MNLDNLIEIMEMLGGELRPVSQWPLSVYNYRGLEKQAASLSESQKEHLAMNSGLDEYNHINLLDEFLDDITWEGRFDNLFFFSEKSK